MKSGVSRRKFLATAASTTAMAMTARSYASILGANSRIGVGLIGAGGMGSEHIDAISKLKESNNLNPLAVADCWKKRTRKAQQESRRQTLSRITASSWRSRRLTMSPLPRPSTGTHKWRSMY